jgi:hypothetical protein
MFESRSEPSDLAAMLQPTAASPLMAVGRLTASRLPESREIALDGKIS